MFNAPSMKSKTPIKKGQQLLREYVVVEELESSGPAKIDPEVVTLDAALMTTAQSTESTGPTEEYTVKYYEETDAVLVGDWEKKTDSTNNNTSIISKVTGNETYNASATYQLTTSVPGYYTVYSKSTHSNILNRIPNVECFATDKHGTKHTFIDQTDPDLNEVWNKIATLYVESTPSASVKITNAGGRLSGQYVSVDAIKIVEIKNSFHTTAVPFELYYSLYLPEYTDVVAKRKHTSVSFQYILNSNQSQASEVGHYNAMSVRVLTNSDGTQRMNDMYLMFKGFRTPSDADSNHRDEDGNIIKRDVKRMYLEEYEITKLDENGINIGGLSGQLHYQDGGSGTTTSVPRLFFPISHAYGIYENYKNGYIDWNYDNTGLYLRKLIVNPPGNSNPWDKLSKEVAANIANLSTVVGYTLYPLIASTNAIQTQQTNLGQLVADAILWRARLNQPVVVDKDGASASQVNEGSIQGIQVDIALKNAGSFYNYIIPVGNVSSLDISKAIKFMSNLVICQLDVKQLLATIENSISSYPSPTPRYLQSSSNVSVEFDKFQPGVENRSTIDKPSRIINLSIIRANGVKDVVVENGIIQGDLTRLFGVAVNNFLFSGGDEYAAFPVVASNKERATIKININDQEIVTEYISQVYKDKKIDIPSVLGESVFINKPEKKILLATPQQILLATPQQYAEETIYDKNSTSSESSITDPPSVEEYGNNLVFGSTNTVKTTGNYYVSSATNPSLEYDTTKPLYLYFFKPLETPQDTDTNPNAAVWAQHKTYLVGTAKLTKDINGVFKSDVSIPVKLENTINYWTIWSQRDLNENYFGANDQDTKLKMSIANNNGKIWEWQGTLKVTKTT
jgi:hypothetical protein